MSLYRLFFSFLLYLERQNSLLHSVGLPFISREISRVASVWKVLPKHNAVAQSTESGAAPNEIVQGRNFFQYDNAFGPEQSTKTVYDSVAKNIVASVCTGLNGTIFAYGQTSSGKTYTMQGSGTIAE